MVGGEHTRDHSVAGFWQAVGSRISPTPTLRVPQRPCPPCPAHHRHVIWMVEAMPLPAPHTIDTSSGWLIPAEAHGADDDIRTQYRGSIRPLVRLQIVPCMEVGCVCG